MPDEAPFGGTAAAPYVYAAWTWVYAMREVTLYPHYDDRADK